MRLIRRLYDWVLGWADTKYGAPALVCIAFVESSVFPIPPDVLLVALCLGNRSKWLRLAAMCTAASVAGGMAGYAIGWGLWQSVDQFFFAYVFSEEAFNAVQNTYDKWNFWIVFVAAFTPIPYKVITITAGVASINFAMFVVAATIGRGARFLLVAFLIHHYGEPVKDFIDRRFNWVAIAFVVILVGGFAVLKYVPR